MNEPIIKIYKDGDMWCAFIGDNIQEGDAGFGKTPFIALIDLALSKLELAILVGIASKDFKLDADKEEDETILKGERLPSYPTGELGCINSPLLGPTLINTEFRP